MRENHRSVWGIGFEEVQSSHFQHRVGYAARCHIQRPRLWGMVSEAVGRYRNGKIREAVFILSFEDIFRQLSALCRHQSASWRASRKASSARLFRSSGRTQAQRRISGRAQGGHGNLPAWLRFPHREAPRSADSNFPAGLYGRSHREPRHRQRYVRSGARARVGDRPLRAHLAGAQPRQACRCATAAGEVHTSCWGRAFL